MRVSGRDNQGASSMWTKITSPKSWIDTLSPAEGAPPRRLYPFMHWCLKGSYFAILIGSIATIVAGCMEMVTAALLGIILDVVLDAGPENVIADQGLFLAGAAIFILFARPLTFMFSAYMQSVVIGPNLRKMVMTRLHRWTLGHSTTFFDNDFAGRIAQKEVTAARALTDVVVEFLHTVLFAVASIVAAFVIVATIDWRIGAMVILWVFGFFGLMKYYLPRIRVRSAARAEAQAVTTGQIVDTVSNVKVVKLFANAFYEDKAALKAFDFLRQTSKDYGVMLIWFRMALLTYSGVIFIGVIFATIYLWMNGQATPGAVVAGGSVAMRLMMMAGWVSFSMMTIYSNLGEVENGMITLTPPHTLVDADDAKALVVNKAEVRFDSLSFAYGREKGGIKNITLTVQPGEKLGIVGASGAGKSTLVSLLLRLHDAEQGSVLIDGQNLRDVTQDSLRNQIGMVTQETSMFNRSAKDNILYGRPEASDEEVLKAAQKAEADEFIRDIVDNKGRKGYDAHLGERGVKLSGGQRQRIALARAILKDAPILVLDEATSALDSEVEASIQTALERVMEGKTVLAIAHRLSTIARMDRIIVLDQGEIVEEGTHSDLLARNGLYAQYWNRQSGGFIGIDQAAE